MAAPPSSGALHDTASRPSPGASTGAAGAAGAPVVTAARAGVPETVPDHAPQPAALCARARNSWETPSLSPLWL